MSNEFPPLLVGAGAMAIQYAQALDALGIAPTVLGRGHASAQQFSEKTGLPVGTGDLQAQLDALTTLPETAIVAVNAHKLAEVSARLIQHGVKRVLVEKPAVLDLAELEMLSEVQAANSAEVRIAYNRRFLSSVLRAQEIIAADGGLVSLRFDFTEPSRRIASLEKPDRELLTWFYGNSTHVVDLAFHLFGTPTWLQSHVSGAGLVKWHPQASIFSGFGENAQGAVISWHSNWASPGRWGLEAMTSERRLILQPLEGLRIQDHNSFSEHAEAIEDADDKRAKPGLIKQLQAFLFGMRESRLAKLEDHSRHMQFFEAIRLGHSWGASDAG